jgi:predicted transcriptional regulator
VRQSKLALPGTAVTIKLPDELVEIIKKVAESLDVSEEEALEEIVRDWSIGQGLLQDNFIDEDTPTEGSA